MFSKILWISLALLVAIPILWFLIRALLYWDPACSEQDKGKVCGSWQVWVKVRKYTRSDYPNTVFTEKSRECSSCGSVKVLVTSMSLKKKPRRNIAEIVSSDRIDTGLSRKT